MAELLNVWDGALTAFGKKVKDRRKALGMTQGSLAEAINSATSYVSEIERGRANPTLFTMLRLADALETDFQSLTEGIEL